MNVGMMMLAALGLLGLYGLVVFLKRRGAPQKDGRVGWSWLESIGIAVFIYFAAFFATQLLAGLGLGIYANHQGLSSHDAAGLLDGSVTVQFLVAGVFAGLILLFVHLFLQLRRTVWAAIGLVRFRPRDLGYALLGFLVYMVAYMVLAAVVKGLVPGLDFDQRQDLGFDTSSSGPALALVFISLVVLPPLAEEILMRGVVFTGLRTKLPLVGAMVITSVLFGAAHLPGGTDGTLIWAATLDTFTLSLVLCYLREKTGSLWACIGLHAIKNCIAFAALFIFHIA